MILSQFVGERIVAFQSVAKGSYPEVSLLVVAYVEDVLRLAVTEGCTVVLSRHFIHPSEAFGVGTYPQTTVNILLNVHDSGRHSATLAGRNEMCDALMIGIKGIETVLIGSHPERAVGLAVNCKDARLAYGISVSLMFTEAIEYV